jgi:ABC-2 type transport system permease protein
MVLDFFKGWTPHFLVETISSFSFLTHFNAISKGIIDLRDLIYFFTLMAFWLFATAILIEMKKAD